MHKIFKILLHTVHCIVLDYASDYFDISLLFSLILDGFIKTDKHCLWWPSSSLQKRKNEKLTSSVFQQYRVCLPSDPRISLGFECFTSHQFWAVRKYSVQEARMAAVRDWKASPWAWAWVPGPYQGRLLTRRNEWRGPPMSLGTTPRRTSARRLQLCIFEFVCCS